MRVLELFAGAGGATTGLIEAGLDVLRCIERDADVHATALAAGHPSVLGDVRDAGLDIAADLVWSSFPCQAWSVAGKRLGAADERNGWPATIATVRRVRPTWFIGENVIGLTLHARRAHAGDAGVDPRDCPGCYFEHVVLRELRATFAEVSWRILDAADFGVPQRRRRVFIVAGPRPFRWPEPTHADPVLGRIRGRRPWNAMGDVIGDVRVERRHFGSLATSRPELLARPAPTLTTTESKGTRGDAMFGTTAAGKTRGGPDRASDVLWLATGIRRLTVDQCAALQAFPPDYPWRGSQESVYRQIGNAVPPTVAEALGRALLAASPATFTRRSGT